jgi:hypothetical protein
MTRDEIIKQMGWPSNANSTISDLVDRVEAVVRKAEEAAAIRARRKQMTERELLELAAKAAGIAYIKPAEGYDGSLGLAAGSHPMQTHPWNPLADDGDALRLAVKLRINFNFHVASVHCSKLSSLSSPNLVIREFEFYENAPVAATRRAIVRAAAEIGRKMP